MRIKRKTLRKTVLIAGSLLVIAILLLVVLFVYRDSMSGEQYGVDTNGVLHAPDRISLHSTRAVVNTTENIVLERVTYDSNATTIVGYLYTPANAQSRAGGRAMLLLPGGGVTKEGEGKAAMAFARRGIIVLTIDQRGVGETGGPFNDLDADYAAFLAAAVPTNHLLVLDALAGVQLLHETPGVNHIWIAGESMGGRAAIVAARVDSTREHPLTDGLLIVSSAGFGDPQILAGPQRFLRSFDPDANIAAVGVPILQIHSHNDSIIPFEAAKATNARATAPTRFLTLSACDHGYCAQMEPLLDDGLAWLNDARR